MEDKEIEQLREMKQNDNNDTNTDINSEMGKCVYNLWNVIGKSSKSVIFTILRISIKIKVEEFIASIVF